MIRYAARGNRGGLTHRSITGRLVRPFATSTRIAMAALFAASAVLSLMTSSHLELASATSARAEWSTRADFERNSSTVGLSTNRAIVSTVLRPDSVILPTGPVMLAAGTGHTLGLLPDGAVIATGDNSYEQVEIMGWSGIVSVAAGSVHSLGLKADGTVVATGDNSAGQCDVGDWTGIVAIAAGETHSLGLKADGTVVAAGSNESGQCDVSEWSDITSISAGGSHSVGLRSDGTATACGDNSSTQCAVASWSGISVIAAGHDHTVGVTAAGELVSTGETPILPCESPESLDPDGISTTDEAWSGVTDVAAGADFTVALKTDGTVVARGSDGFDQCDVESWTGIVDIAAGAAHTIGLRDDGTVIATGFNSTSQCDVSTWSDEGFGQSVGTIGGYGHAVGLRFGEPDALLRWTQLDIDADVIEPGDAVKLAVRVSDDGAVWSEPLGRDGAAVDWTSGSGTYFGATKDDGAPYTDLSEIDASRFIDVVVRIESKDGSSPELRAVFLDYESAETQGIVRTEGADRYETAIEVSRRAFPDGAGTVVIATGTGWADALSGSALAGTMSGPLLITSPDELNASVAEEIVRLGAGEAYLLGGEKALPEAIAARIETLLGGGSVIRIAGSDRYETSSKVAAAVIELQGDTFTGAAYVATGANFADALAASPLAARERVPLILARPGAGAPDLHKSITSVKLLGGTAAIPAQTEAELAANDMLSSVTRVAGADRYETAALLACDCISENPDSRAIGIVTGEDFPDALTGGVMLATLDAPMLLTTRDSLSECACDVLARHDASITTIYIIGGAAAITPAIEIQAESILGMAR